MQGFFLESGRIEDYLIVTTYLFVYLNGTQDGVEMQLA